VTPVRSKSTVLALALVLTGVALAWRHPLVAQATAGRSECGRNSTAPQRLVSVSLTSDYLLMRLVGIERLAAISWVVDQPEYSPDAGRVPASIPRLDGQAEAIVALQPDLAVVADFPRPALAAQLRAMDVSVFELSAPTSLRAIVDDVERLGDCVGATALSRPWAAQLRSRIGAVQRHASTRQPIRVLVVDAGVAQGRGTLVDDLLTQLGAVNPARATGLEGGISLDAERLLTWKPDVVFVAVPGPRVIADGTGYVSSIPGWTLFERSPERKPRRIVGIPLSQLGAASPLAVDALEAMDRIVGEVIG
jgi:iron complex transport system substrate-binding protein